jgi:hypothetical protein
LFVSLPQQAVEAGLANGTSLAAVALDEMMTAGVAIELRAGHRLAV